MNIIALLGKKQTGKTTVANILAEDPRYVPMAFADPLKELCVEVTQVAPIVFESSQYKDTLVLPKARLTPRRIMQAIGEGMKQKLGQDVFIKQMDARLNELSEDSIPVITDVRFPSEYEYLKTKGPVAFIRIEKEGMQIADGHVSEAYELEANFVLRSKPGDLAGLRHGLAEIFHILSGE